MAGPEPQLLTLASTIGLNNLLGYKFQHVQQGQAPVWCYLTGLDQTGTRFTLQDEYGVNYPGDAPLADLRIGYGTRDQYDPLLTMMVQVGVDPTPFYTLPPFQAPAGNVPFGAANAFVQGQVPVNPAAGFNQGVNNLAAGGPAVQSVFDQGTYRPALSGLIDTTLVEYGNNPNFAPWKTPAKYCSEVYNEPDLKIAHLMSGTFALASRIRFKSEDLSHEADSFSEEIKAEIAKYGPSSTWTASTERELENFIRQKYFSHLAKADSILGKGNARPIAVTANNRLNRNNNPGNNRNSFNRGPGNRRNRDQDDDAGQDDRGRRARR